jgi:SnoaL-like polyketide cyclase
MSTEANKALVRRYFEDLANHADLSVAADIITPEHVADVQHLIRMLHTAFPDFHVTIEEQIAEGALVATRFTASGTHRGSGTVHWARSRRPASGFRKWVSGSSALRTANWSKRGAGLIC